LKNTPEEKSAHKKIIKWKYNFQEEKLAMLTASPTRGSTPCSMKRCIVRCSFVEDFLFYRAFLAPALLFVNGISTPLRGLIM
jgi:hypothetical protein